MTVTSSLVPLRAHRAVRKVVRCLAVSVLTTLLSLTVLAALTTAAAMTAWVANVLATAAGTVVSYRLNREWVWGRHDASDPWREIVPFWALSFAGLAVSTLSVATADHWATAVHLTGAAHTAVVLAASVAGYAALWIAEFVVLDRLLFGARSRASRPMTEERAR